jgi:hypothetical protein
VACSSEPLNQYRQNSSCYRLRVVLLPALSHTRTSRQRVPQSAFIGYLPRLEMMRSEEGGAHGVLV